MLAIIASSQHSLSPAKGGGTSRASGERVDQHLVLCFLQWGYSKDFYRTPLHPTSLRRQARVSGRAEAIWLESYRASWDIFRNEGTARALSVPPSPPLLCTRICYFQCPIRRGAHLHIYCCMPSYLARPSGRVKGGHW